MAQEKGTQLHFLRTEYPHRSYDIAKVIRGDLLDRSDLVPALIEPNNGLYGVSLNLERLEI
ncbi:ATP-binding protein [Chromobacterium violaceum]|uniref:ATP-binding protein n=1 Tax=Chromobacterium violaceum TaxID=536 RepID=UPI000E20B5D2